MTDNLTFVSARVTAHNSAMDERQRERYARHILLKEVGGQGQKTLLSARVLVVGAGGIGAPLVQYLAAAGVGTIAIADDDAVALSNLQRQVIYRETDIGRAKVDAAADFAARLNPDAHIEKHCIQIDDDNAPELIAKYDLVVEGVDNFETRFALNRAAIAKRKTLVSAAVGRFEGHLSVFKGYERALACYRCFMPHEPPREDRITCAEEGVLGAVTGVLGTLAAVETLKEILGIGQSLAGRLMIYDGLSAACRTVALPKDPACPDCQPAAASR